MPNLKDVAFEAAKTAGAILRERVGHIKNIDFKSAFNLVTDVDKESEATILSILREAFPDDQILAEETGAHAAKNARRWLIDPLDGTTNFTHSYPCFAVSIGVEEDGEGIFGVVYNPISDELFWAEKGKGAYLNDRPIKVSTTSKLESCLLATGFPADSKAAKISNMEQFQRITDITQGVRRDGSAALDLSFVACGRFDGFWELKLAPWDLGAGTVILREAGGKVTNLTGGAFDITTGHVLATNGHIHQELINALDFASVMPKESELGASKDVARK